MESKDLKQNLNTPSRSQLERELRQTIERNPEFRSVLEDLTTYAKTHKKPRSNFLIKYVIPAAAVAGLAAASYHMAMRNAKNYIDMQIQKQNEKICLNDEYDTKIKGIKKELYNKMFRLHERIRDLEKQKL